MRRVAYVLALTVVLLAARPAAAPAQDPHFVGWPTLLPAFATRYAPSSADDCVAGRIQCVDAVLRQMNRRFDPLAASCDHDAIFALAYLRTTEEYRRAVQEPGFFTDPAFINHEDAVFAAFYFAAYDAWHSGAQASVPAAWRIAFDAAAKREVTASGNLSLGINAHIQRDLPFVLAAIGLVKPDGSSRKPDHDKVNEFLNRVSDGLIAEIARRFDPTIDDGNLPTEADDLAIFQLIPTWRETAWRNAERLAAARTDADRARVAAEIEAYAASQAHLLREPARYPPGMGSAARDAFCATHHG